MEADNIVVTKIVIGRILKGFCNRGVNIIRLEKIKIR